MRIKALVIVLIFLLFISSVSSTVLKQGEVYEVGGKELTVENIREDMIKINVDGVKNLINVGKQKEVNGVDILVVSVVYFDEPEFRTADVVVSMAYYCGDGNCDRDYNETQENCCNDCGCKTGYVCSGGICKTEAQVKKEQEEEEEASRDECKKDIDCNDGDPVTEDVCRHKPGKPNKCLNLPPICQTASDCDDEDPCTVDRCVDNDCFRAKVPDYIACWQKREALELEEKEKLEETVPGEILEKKEIFEEAIEKEKGIFSRIISFFLNLF